LLNSLCYRWRVAVRHYETIFAITHYGSAVSGRNNRNSCGHRFEQNYAESVRERWKNKHIGG
jgi:hypothetical protein